MASCTLRYIAVLTILLTGSAYAGGEPEYIGNFAARVGSAGDYTPLERVKPRTEVHTRLLGFAGGESNLVIPGQHSPIRFKTGSTIQIITRVENQSHDPMTVLQLYSVKVDSENRLLQLVDAGAFGIGAESTMEKYSVPFTAAKFGKEYFIMTPSLALEPGEYCAGSKDSQDGYCFGVDP